MKTAVQITIYLSESDNCEEILTMLSREKVASACAFHAMGGFNGGNRMRMSSLVEAGGDLPVVIVFVDLAEHVDRVLPKLFALAPHRLIVRENVAIEQGNLE